MRLLTLTTFLIHILLIFVMSCFLSALGECSVLSETYVKCCSLLVWDWPCVYWQSFFFFCGEEMLPFLRSVFFCCPSGSPSPHFLFSLIINVLSSGKRKSPEIKPVFMWTGTIYSLDLFYKNIYKHTPIQTVREGIVPFLSKLFSFFFFLDPEKLNLPVQTGAVFPRLSSHRRPVLSQK